MATFTIAVNGGRNAFEFEVHSAGCADVARGVRGCKYSHSYDVPADSALDAIKAEVAEFTGNEQDWFENDFRIMPCASSKEVRT